MFMVIPKEIYCYEQSQTVMGGEYLPHHPSLPPVCLLNNDGLPDSFCSTWCWCYGPGGSDRTGCFSSHQSISIPKWARSLEVEHRLSQQCQATQSGHAGSKHSVPPTAGRGSLGRSRKTTGCQLVMGGREHWRNQRSNRQWSAG